MDIWKGAFAPWRKHIQTTKYVSLEDMTREDWIILDYPNLRPIPKQRIEKQAIEGLLCGFNKVEVDMHKATVHGGKPIYFWPAAGDDDNVELENFENFDEYEGEAESPATFTKEYARLDKKAYGTLKSEARVVGLDRTDGWPKWALIIGIIAKEACNKQNNEQQEEMQDN